MIDTVYIEEEVKNHFRTEKFLAERRFERVIYIEKYTEVFNRKAQNFRLQKKKPALILAKKHGALLQKIPESYGIGGKRNYYFSHLLNCPFDCSYCFLQGMYRSANYVWFLNYEDFQKEIEKEILQEAQTAYFFSGYDGDSLALEAFTHFAEEFLSFFEKHPKGILELRTKSLFIRPLLQREPFENCIAAFTLSPESIAKEIELKAPPLIKRLQAAAILQKRGWKIGLRFDPLIFDKNFYALYGEFFQKVFEYLSSKNLHSVTLGTFRLPKIFYSNMKNIEAGSKLIAALSEETPGKMDYTKELREKMLSFCHQTLLQYLPHQRIHLQ